MHACFWGPGLILSLLPCWNHTTLTAQPYFAYYFILVSKLPVPVISCGEQGGCIRRMWRVQACASRCGQKKAGEGKWARGVRAGVGGCVLQVQTGVGGCGGLQVGVGTVQCVRRVAAERTLGAAVAQSGISQSGTWPLRITSVTDRWPLHQASLYLSRHAGLYRCIQQPNCIGLTSPYTAQHKMTRRCRIECNLEPVWLKMSWDLLSRTEQQSLYNDHWGPILGAYRCN